MTDQNTETPPPDAEGGTPAAAASNLATANLMRNIATLLRKGLFFGENAAHVQEALGFLDKFAALGSSAVKQEKAAKKRAVKALKAVPRG